MSKVRNTLKNPVNEILDCARLHYINDKTLRHSRKAQLLEVILDAIGTRMRISLCLANALQDKQSLVTSYLSKDKIIQNCKDAAPKMQWLLYPILCAYYDEVTTLKSHSNDEKELLYILIMNLLLQDAYENNIDYSLDCILKTKPS